MQQARKTLVANKIVLKSKELTSIALTCLTLRDFHEVSQWQAIFGIFAIIFVVNLCVSIAEL